MEGSSLSSESCNLGAGATHVKSNGHRGSKDMWDLGAKRLALHGLPLRTMMAWKLDP